MSLTYEPASEPRSDRFETDKRDRSAITSKGPSWGCLCIVLGAVASFVSTFGQNVPRFPENPETMTFELPPEGPGLGKHAQRRLGQRNRNMHPSSPFIAVRNVVQTTERLVQN